MYFNVFLFEVFIVYNFSPHSGQNFAFSLTSAPQLVQNFFVANFSPHSGQNLAFIGTLAPHLTQVLLACVGT